jgi:hypothetical protein
MDTRRRIMFITGIMLFLAGCITGLYLVARIFIAQLKGIVWIASDAPMTRFRDLRCPLMVSKNDTAPIAGSIFNPTTQDLDYHILIYPHGFVVRPPGEEMSITAPGWQTTEITWSVTAVEPGDQAILVEALSERDLADPNGSIFSSWPTSFQRTCGILVSDSPWMGRWGAGLSLASLAVGAALTCPWLYAGIRARIKTKKKYRFRWWTLMALGLGMAASILADGIATDNAVYGYWGSSYPPTSILSILDFTKWERLLGAEPPPRVVDFKAWEGWKRSGSWEDVDFEAWERHVYGNNLGFWDWQRQKYGSVITANWGDGPPDYRTREAAWKQSPEYQVLRARFENWEYSPEHQAWQAREAYFKQVDSIVFGLRILGELSFLLFLVRGIAGGIILSIKKLGGWRWILVLLAWIVIPLGLLLTFWVIMIVFEVLSGLRGGGTAGFGYPVWLAMMMLLGELVYYWGKNATPSRRKCRACRAWMPYTATQCPRCGKPVRLLTANRQRMAYT